MDYLNPSIYQKDSAGKWVASFSQWKYQLEDGRYANYQWVEIQGLWYLFDHNGYMVKGWVLSDGKQYLLHEDGTMSAGNWVLHYGKWYAFHINGSMMSSEWYEYKNAWYYLGENGIMLVNTTTPDGYFVNSEGKWIP